MDPAAGCYPIINCTGDCGNGTCDYKTGVCQCDPDFTGSNCENRLLCNSQPCQNSGTCTQSPDSDSFNCSCLSNFYGSLCQFAVVSPIILSVTPNILSPSGGNITVVGIDFQSPLLLKVLSGNTVLAQVSVSSFTTVSRRRSSQGATFAIPAITDNGYVSLQFINPSGGSYSYSGFYITPDCPTPGYYGIGADCHPCPVGAVCPGGDRLWPDIGYWNPNEQTVPVACPAPAARCPGGQNSPCAQGYTGNECTTCAVNNEPDASSGGCIACPTTGCSKSDAATYGYGLNGGEIAAIAFAYIVLMALLGVAGYFVYKRYFVRRKKQNDDTADIIDAYQSERVNFEMSETDLARRESQPEQKTDSSQPLPAPPPARPHSRKNSEDGDSKNRSAVGIALPPSLAAAAAAAAAAAVSIPEAEITIFGVPEPATTPARSVSQGQFDFQPRERLFKKEIEGACHFKTHQFIATRPALISSIDETKRVDQVIARIKFRVFQKVQERTDELVIPDNTGRPSRYYDGLQIQAIVEAVTEDVVMAVVGSLPSAANNAKLVYQVADDQGPRPLMEDKCIAEVFANELIGADNGPQTSIFAVYDGHGGPLTAEYVAKFLHVNLIRDDYFKRNIGDALREAFLSTNEFFFQFADREGHNDNVGTTAVLAMIRDGKLWCAWAGDSEACLYRTNGDVLPLCLTHKPWLEKEKERIEMMGGTVEMRGGLWRVCGALAVARAFGDSRYRQYITAEPDFVCLDLQGDEEYLVVACDGLWDVMSHQAVGTYLSQYTGGPKDGMTESLVEHARNIGSTDNITAIVVMFGGSE